MKRVNVSKKTLNHKVSDQHTQTKTTTTRRGYRNRREADEEVVEELDEGARDSRGQRERAMRAHVRVWRRTMRDESERERVLLA